MKTKTQPKINALLKSKTKKPLNDLKKPKLQEIGKKIAQESKEDDTHRLEILEKLKRFDLDQKYGPCIGLTRLERYQRAIKLSLHPPPELLPLLEEPLDEELRECLWFNRV